MAMTVLGPKPVADLGMTLFHEHLHMDATPLLAVHGYDVETSLPYDSRAAAEARWNPGSHADNYRLTENELVSQEVGLFRDAGGGTIVEQTPPALGRDPGALQAIATASGINVVMGAGHYLAATHAPWVAGASDEELADRLSTECRRGDEASGVRPGIIGEIGTSIPIEPDEARVLRAAACAALESGLAVSVHLHPWGHTGIEALDVLLDAGLAPERVALGHLTTAWDDEGYLLSLADRGATLVFDLFGFDHSLIGVGRWPPSDLDVARAVTELVTKGYGEQVMISHDIGVRSRLVAYGSWGYAHIPRHVVPLLLELGMSDREVHQLLVANPARMLAVDGL